MEEENVRAVDLWEELEQEEQVQGLEDVPARQATRSARCAYMSRRT